MKKHVVERFIKRLQKVRPTASFEDIGVRIQYIDQAAEVGHRNLYCGR